MAVTLYTEDQIFNITIGYFAALFPRADLSDRGYFGLVARSFAQVAVLCQYAIEAADNDGTPAYQQAADGTVRSKCSSESLDAWAFVFGLPSGVPGIYGRRIATVSTGGSAIPTGTAGTLVLAGTLALDSTGQVTVKTTADVTLNGPPNTLSVPFVSVSTGTAANLPVGTVLTWIGPPAGLDSTVRLTSALTDALDVESDADLVARIIHRIQNPPRGGTAADYQAWCEESVDANGASNGIIRAYIFALRSGLGSVDMVVTVGGSGTNRQPGGAAILAVQAYVNTKKPVTATANVLAPYFDPSKALRVLVRAVPSTAKNGIYLYDWNDAATGTTITGHTATTLTVGSVPLSLLMAAAAGVKPRLQIQISSAGASPKPFQARVVSIVGTTITLDTPFPSPPVDGFDVIFAGSSIVDIVASNILAYVDSLGPSTQSGFADTNAPWQSTVSLSHIIQTVLDSRDTDGTSLVSDMLGFNPVVIGVGTGAYATQSYVPRDIGAGIELPYLRSGGILVVGQ